MKGRTGVRWLAAVAAVAVLATVAGMSTASGQSASRSASAWSSRSPGRRQLRPGVREAAGLAVQQAKTSLRRAGITNVKIEIEYADDGTTPEGGVNAARTMISKGADCILGALTSGSSIAIAQAATVPARVPQIGPNNSSPALTDLKDNGYFFRTMPSDTLQAPILARLIKEEMGAGKTISLAGRNDAFGTGPSDPQDGARAGRDEDPGAVALRPDRRELQLRGRRHRQGQPWTLRHPRLPGELREDRLGAPAHRPVQRAQALRRRRLAGHDPVVHPDCVARGRTRHGRGLTDGTKAAESFHRLFTARPGRRTARRWTRTTSTER